MRNQLPLTLLGIEAKERSLLTSSTTRDLEVGTRGQFGHKFLELVTLGQGPMQHLGQHPRT